MNQKKAKAIRRAARKIAQELGNVAPTYVHTPQKPKKIIWGWREKLDSLGRLVPIVDIVTPEVITLIGGPRFYQQKIKHRLLKAVDITLFKGRGDGLLIRRESGRVRLQELVQAERAERQQELDSRQ